MEIIVNKTYKRKGTNDVLKLVNIENGFAVFENNARCKIETLMSDFEDGNAMSSPPIFENQSFVQSNGPIDPDTFFAPPTAIDPGLFFQLETAIKNPNAQLKRSIADQPSRDLTDNKVIGKPVIQQPNQEFNIPPSMMPKKPINALNDRLNEESQQNDVISPNEYPEPQASPEEIMFNKVKKTELVEFTLQLKIKLPKARHIETLNDMFETSFISHLAKQAIQDLLNNPSKLKAELVTQMEKWLEDQYEEKPTKDKKKGKKKEQKEEPTPKTVTTEETPIDTKVVLNGSGENKFGLPPDLPFDITNEEDLGKIQAHIKKLYDDKSKDFQQIDHYENLVVIYKNKPKV